MLGTPVVEVHDESDVVSVAGVVTVLDDEISIETGADVEDEDEDDNVDVAVVKAADEEVAVVTVEEIGII